MIQMKDKVILTDIDGVVLNWVEGFIIWMEHRGHTLVDNYRDYYNVNEMFGITKESSKPLVEQFNSSAAMGFLPPLRDAQYYMRKLHEKHGYKFVAVTSLSSDPYAKKLRERNLAKLFGDDMFLEVICLDCGADKDEILLELKAEYDGCYWIEDKTANAIVGADLGYDTLLMEHKYNMDALAPRQYLGKTIGAGFKLMKNWEGIYNEIIQR